MRNIESTEQGQTSAFSKVVDHHTEKGCAAVCHYIYMWSNFICVHSALIDFHQIFRLSSGNLMIFLGFIFMYKLDKN